MAGIEKQISDPRAPEDGRAVRRHRPQAGLQFGLGGIAALGQNLHEIGEHGGGAGRVGALVIAVDLRRSGNPETRSERRDTRLVLDIMQRHLGCARAAGGERAGIVLDRIDRQLDAERALL